MDLIGSDRSWMYRGSTFIFILSFEFDITPSVKFIVLYIYILTQI
ncbi:uncharacterized protein METZ01_LOCUS182631 [marine metagenome]|uniref:Uncharacterized protein n=1 Tax=marine metagenome TaxID=408172 RepID=A0A382CWS3_9ZZZZ